MNEKDEVLFCDYFQKWVDVYKRAAVRNVTLRKYLIAESWIRRLIPDVKVKHLDRMTYQQMINEYGKTHEMQTVKDFNVIVKACVQDLIDEGVIQKDPTKKVALKGIQEKQKKQKYLDQYQLHRLLESLDLGEMPSYEWLIYLIAKTGMRFSEAIALTPKEFDFQKQVVRVERTWNYKEGGGFVPTKNRSSVRAIRLDWDTAMRIGGLIRDIPEDERIFGRMDPIFNSTPNGILRRYCRKLEIPEITIHGLRHTHASLLLYAGASVASVARRLGHSNMTTTQKTYLHIIQELENQDVDLIMRAMSAI